MRRNIYSTPHHTKLRNGQRRSSSNGVSCSCPFTRPPKIWPSYHRFNMLWYRTSTHLRSCPFFALSQTSDTIGAQYMYCGRLLGFLVETTLTFTRGAGGMSICPRMMFRAVVSRNSLGFSLFRSCWYELTHSTQSLLHISQKIELLSLTSRDLRKAFQEGKAGPNDVLSDGRTLLHV